MNPGDFQHNDALLDSYRENLRLEKNLTANTVSAYTDDVEKLLRYLTAAGILTKSFRSLRFLLPDTWYAYLSGAL